MLIYPAIDLLRGRCARLLRGDFDQATEYSSSPAEMLARYAASGAEWVHIVDLDGAREGAPVQHALLKELARFASLKVQVAGGVRARDDVARLLDAGAARVVVGSKAVSDPAAVAAWITEFGADSIALALDVKIENGLPLVAVKGWTELAQASLCDALDAFPSGLVRHVLVTSIARDGAMEGPDLVLYETIVRDRRDLSLQASGGVRGLDDIAALKRAGVAGAVVGKALYEGALDLSEAVRAGA